MISERRPFAWRGVGVVVAVQAAVLLAMSPFYGPHRDELYFVSAGQRLAWGYPDQPSFSPFLARIATEIAPQQLVVLRVWSLLAVIALVLLAVQYSRLLGGGGAAQVLTATCVAVGAVVMTLGHRVSTATFDTLAWTAVLVVATQALVDRRPRLWLVAGVAAGVGLNNKHAVVVLLLGILVGLALDPAARPALRTPWPWLAGLVAGAMWLPNLLWQARHDWPAFALADDIAEEYGGLGGRLGMLGEAFSLLSPLIGVLWVIGLVQLLRREDWRPARLPAFVFLAVTAAFLVTGGKGYYLAGATVPLVAAGSTWLADRWSTRGLVLAGAGLAASSMLIWPTVVPVLPTQTFADSVYPSFNDDQTEMIGWPEYAAQIRAVVRDQPDGAVVFAGNYGEAGASEWYDVGAPVYSGHNGWREWGPPPDGAGPVVVVGYRDPSVDFTGCQRAATLHNDVGIDNEEEGRDVWICAGPIDSWSRRWHQLSHYDA